PGAGPPEVGMCKGGGTGAEVAAIRGARRLSAMIDWVRRYVLADADAGQQADHRGDLDPATYTRAPCEDRCRFAPPRRRSPADFPRRAACSGTPTLPPPAPVRRCRAGRAR